KQRNILLPKKTPQEMQQMFEEFNVKYNKKYASLDQSSYRLNIFTENYNFIQDRNQQITNLVLEINQYTDLTLEEFRQLHSGYQQKQKKTLRLRKNTNFQNEDLPESVDWRDKLTTPVQKQGACGSCWAFSTIVALEAAYAKQTGEIVKLSEQNVMDCCKLEDKGCNGGDPESALNCVTKLIKGIMKEDDYPYQAITRKQCDFVKEKSVYLPDNYEDITPKNELVLKSFVAKQPVSTCIGATTQIFQFYKSGIISHSEDCLNLPDHCIGIVGYGVEDDNKYWIVKNSWGNQWGEQGYVRILRTDNSNDIGMCAIASEPRIVNWQGGNNNQTN
ncbi:papain family cysteine protease, putative, partial [Ichthyophthirius multifiliis]